MANVKWFDQSQPQTLQGAVIFCYLNAAFGILYFLRGAPLSAILILLGVTAYFIANDRRWAYWSGVVIAGVYLALQLVAFFTFQHSFAGILNLLFAAILVALLLHPQSRAYQKIWFH